MRGPKWGFRLVGGCRRFGLRGGGWGLGLGFETKGVGERKGGRGKRGGRGEEMGRDGKIIVAGIYI